jgi:hypothetical protein
MGIGLLLEFVGAALEDGSASPFDLRFSADQLGKEIIYLLLHCGLGSKAQVGRHLLAHPAPNRLFSIEIRAIAGQSLSYA